MPTIHTVPDGAPLLWFQNDKRFWIGDDAWAPLPFDVGQSDDFNMHPGLTASTTIDAASNGLTLPTATIDLDDASSFPSSGFASIQGPPNEAGTSGAATTDWTIIHWTGKSGDQLTGCNATHEGLSADYQHGQLATGQTITVANVNIDLTTRPYLWNIMPYAWVDGIPFEVAAGDPGKLYMRWRAIDGVFNFPVWTDARVALGTTNNALSNDATPIQCPGQPGMESDGDVQRIEIRQYSGAARRVNKSGIETPIVMGVRASTELPL